MEFQVDDYVYFYAPEGTVPAIVTKVGKKRIQIKGNFGIGDRVVWVKPSNLILQTEAFI